MNGSGKRSEFIAFGQDANELLKYISDSVLNIQAGPSEKYSIDFSRLKKLKLSMKNISGQTCVKCMVEYGQDDTVPHALDTHRSAEDKPEFHVLNNRMNIIFKIIGDKLESGELPSSIETDLFCRNAVLMATYSGSGDNMYSEFLNLVVEFERAIRRSNIGGCREIFNAIRVMKARCHSVFPP